MILIFNGGIINVCTPCLVHRGLDDSPLLNDIIKIKGPDLLEKKDQASKILRSCDNFGADA